jgi:putative flippase GtrA
MTAGANPGELKRYVVSGVSAVVCDTAIYFILVNIVTPSLAKAISFVSGTLVAYLLNKFWTFKKPKRSHTEVVKFVALYVSTLGANVAVNRIVLDVLPMALPALAELSVQVGFLAATGTSTVLNYLGQKFWVFKAGSLPGSSQS